MVDHLDHATLEALAGERERAEHDEAEVAHRRVGDEPLHVGLDDGDHGAVDDPDDGQRGHQPGELDGGLGEERQVEADEAVGAELQQHARQHHRARGGRLGVGVGQPRVEREQRHLDGEGGGEGEEQPGLRRLRDVDEQQILEAEGRAVGDAEPQDRRQHEGRAQGRVDHELDRGVDAVVRAPDPDQEVHRDQRDLEEHEEEDEVERDEHPEETGLEDQHRHHVHLEVLLHRCRGEDRDREQEGGEDDEQQRDAVDADVPRDPPRLVEEHALGELELGTRRPHVELDQQVDGERQRQQRPADRDRHDQLRATVRQQRHDGGADDRNDDEGGEHGEAHQKNPPPATTIHTMSAAVPTRIPAP